VSKVPARRTELRPYIRFQLTQLSAENAEHDFEHLTFDLARVRVASNLLPATGPVQAGGDQGRDFESYRTYLARSSLANGKRPVSHACRFAAMVGYNPAQAASR
jgi:hypothetical protein